MTKGFIDHGVSAATDVAIIENGTRPNQRVITGTLGDIAAKTADAGVKSPAMIIIGSVVRLRDILAPEERAKLTTPHAMSLAALNEQDRHS